MTDEDTSHMSRVDARAVDALTDLCQTHLSDLSRERSRLG